MKYEDYEDEEKEGRVEEEEEEEEEEVGKEVEEKVYRDKNKRFGNNIFLYSGTTYGYIFKIFSRF